MNLFYIVMGIIGIFSVVGCFLPIYQGMWRRQTIGERRSFLALCLLTAILAAVIFLVVPALKFADAIDSILEPEAVPSKSWVMDDIRSATEVLPDSVW